MSSDRAVSVLAFALLIAASHGLVRSADVSGDAMGLAAQAGTPTSDGPGVAGHYEIGAEDLLEITVFELPELNRTVRVAADGSISMPLVGVIPVSGLSQRAVEQRLRALLQERFLENPQVSVFIREHRSKTISVIGAIQTPGTLETLGIQNLLQAISAAGGLTREAGHNLFILRSLPDGGQRRIEIDLHGLTIRGDPELNIALAPGDVINIPIEDPLLIYVSGAVRAPGRIEVKRSDRVTLLQAITQAGGPTDRANERAVLILRRTDGGPNKARIDLKEIKKGRSADPILQDGDVIVVPEAWF